MYLDIAFYILSKIDNFEELKNARLVSKIFNRAFKIIFKDTGKFIVYKELSYPCYIYIPFNFLSFKEALIEFLDESDMVSESIVKVYSWNNKAIEIPIFINSKKHSLKYKYLRFKLPKYSLEPKNYCVEDIFDLKLNNSIPFNLENIRNKLLK
jgi:hypothetical protein